MRRENFASDYNGAAYLRQEWYALYFVQTNIAERSNGRVREVVLSLLVSFHNIIVIGKREDKVSFTRNILLST